MSIKNLTFFPIAAAICLAGLGANLQVATADAIPNNSDPFVSTPLNKLGVFSNPKLQIVGRLPVDDYGIHGAEAVYDGVKGEIRCVPTGIKPLPPRYKALKIVSNYHDVQNGKPGDPALTVRPININGLKFINGLLFTTETPNKSHQCYVTKNACAKKLIDYTMGLSIEEKFTKISPIFGQIVQGITFMNKAGLLYTNFGPDYICLNSDKYGKLEASMNILQPLGNAANVAAPGLLKKEDTKDIISKKLTWATGAVLYKMLSGQDASANYNPKAELPDSFFKSPHLAMKNDKNMIANARTTLKPLIAVMNLMLNPNVNERTLTENLIEKYRATLAIFNQVPVMPPNAKRV
ncbi:hypothetical protein BDF19DRAFT_445966 [Syncephalis fuscata]|nr:hypothetical protein BDF19DRAFT_445966 [Syncephalis fuscata]